jgi:hypothetical protein
MPIPAALMRPARFDAFSFSTRGATETSGRKYATLRTWVLDHGAQPPSRLATLLLIAAKIGCTGQTLNARAKQA